LSESESWVDLWEWFSEECFRHKLCNEISDITRYEGACHRTKKYPVESLEIVDIWPDTEAHRLPIVLEKCMPHSGYEIWLRVVVLTIAILGYHIATRYQVFEDVYLCRSIEWTLYIVRLHMSLVERLP
jgi:hypothetical protein